MVSEILKHNTDFLWPPAASMPNLLTLPPELMGMITNQLEPVDHVSLRSSSKVLWETRDNLPYLTADESVRYHLRYERGSCCPPENILSLVCTYCQRLRPRNCFDDLTIRPKLRSRHCVTCGIYHANVVWTYKDGVEMFGCSGCWTLFPEGTNVHLIASRIVARNGVTRDRATTNRDSALCDPCWTRLFQGRVRQPVSLFWLDTNNSKLTLCPR